MKAKRGQKVCKSCSKVNGARAHTCKHCGAAFVSKSKTPKKKRIKQFEEIEDWRTLERGDRVKVVGRSGSHYVGDSGEKQYLIDSGTYTVHLLDENGIVVYDGGFGYIYMGPEKESTHVPNVIRSPHKLYKVNTPVRPPRTTKNSPQSAQT